MKLHYGPEKAASQFKRAHKSGARIALIIGDEEIKNKKMDAVIATGSDVSAKYFDYYFKNAK